MKSEKCTSTRDAGLGLRHHTRAYVHGDPADVAVSQLALARVQAGADLESEIDRVLATVVFTDIRSRRPVVRPAAA